MPSGNNAKCSAESGSISRWLASSMATAETARPHMGVSENSGSLILGSLE